MTKLTLNRQNHNEPNFEDLDEMIQGLKEFLAEDVNADDKDWGENFNMIIRFQDADGSFSLLDSFEVPCDARVDFCYMPTYICSAVLMKAFMTNPGILAGRESILTNALAVCCGRRLSGHGYDGLSGTLEALYIFIKAGLREFLMYHADICPYFTDMIRELVDELKDREEKSDTKGSWSEDFSDKINSLNKYFLHSTVFVYGTLLKGERNHEIYLHESEYIGLAELSGFEMYDTGYYPAIIPGSGTVKGELYEVSEEVLRSLDQLEGEGSLYIRQCVSLRTEGSNNKLASVYVYNHSVDGLSIIPFEIQPYTSDWKERFDNYVWYVSYGSNMLKERFMHYIKGGRYQGGGAWHEPCADTSDPIAVKTFDIPYDMYFRNSSRSWGNKGVSFLDTTHNGHALGVAYLITREQFRHVSCQENGGCPPERSTWYNTVITVGVMDGHEVVSITNDMTCNYNDPSEQYLDTLRKGIAENYPDMDSERIDQYLGSCIR